MSDKSAFTNDELRLLYQITVSDLSYFKTQQWSVTNYSLLLLAGVVGIFQVTKVITPIERGALFLVAAAVAVAALVILGKLQTSIELRQSRLTAAREHFSVAFYEVWATETKSREFVHAVYFLRAAVVMGAIIVCWLLVRP